MQNYKTNPIRSFVLFILTAATLLGADVTGKWTGTLTPVGDGGGQSFPTLLVLKQEGAKLTGTAGPDASEQHAIQSGKVEGANVTFDLTAGGGALKFVLKLTGDQMTGDATRESDGKKQSAKVALKRDK